MRLYLSAAPARTAASAALRRRVPLRLTGTPAKLAGRFSMKAKVTNQIPAWVEGDLRPVDKLEVHRRGLFHPAVSVFVVAGRNVLIQRRALTKYHTPGLWANTCCTHPHWQEEPQACAVRRLQEELGITGLDPVFRHRVDYRADVGGGMTEHERVDVFVARADADLLIDPDPSEVAETRWIGLYDLAAEALRHPGAYTPWLRIYLKDHLARIFGPAAAI